MFTFVSNDTNNFGEKVYFDVSQPMLGVRFFVKISSLKKVNCDNSLIKLYLI